MLGQSKSNKNTIKTNIIKYKYRIMRILFALILIALIIIIINCFVFLDIIHQNILDIEIPKIVEGHRLYPMLMEKGPDSVVWLLMTHNKSGVANYYLSIISLFCFFPIALYMAGFYMINWVNKPKKVKTKKSKK